LAFVAQAAAAGRLFRTNESVDTIEELDPDTGAVINSFSTPIENSDCSGLAFANNRLFFQSCGSTIYELNSATGAILNSFSSPSENIDGLGFSGTELYLQDYSGIGTTVASVKSTRAASYGGSLKSSLSPSVVAPSGGTIYVLNPNTGATIRVLTPGVELLGGLTYAGGRNTLFASNADNGIIYEINPSTGAVANSFAAPVDDIFGLGYSFARKTLFMGDVESATGTIFEVDPDTGDPINTLLVVPNWSLAADENGAAAVPTMDEWGMILFIALAGLGSVYYLRKMRRTEG
jgi:outer membrane protein assembly factor BamB